MSCVICRELGSDANHEVFIFIGWLSPPWLAIQRDIARRALDHGHKVTFVEMTQFSHPPVSVDFLSALKRTRDAIQERCAILSLGSPILLPISRSPESRWVSESISSELLTKYRGAYTKLLKPLVLIEKRWLENLVSQLQQKLTSIPTNQNSVWIYPNGRFSCQRTVLEYAKKNNIKNLCYEKNRNLGKYFLRNYGVHDRHSMNRDFAKYLDFMPEEVSSEVTEWLQERDRPQSRTNEYSKRFSRTKDLDLRTRENDTRFKVVFFTSSKDELEALGPSWKTFDWQDQYQAFETIMNLLPKENYRFFLRVHPNLKNKSYLDKVRELGRIKSISNQGLQIFGPYSTINSYDLAQAADLVVISRSTIGIETLARGKPVVSTAASYYDAVETLLQFKSPRDIALVDSLAGTYINAFSAKKWIEFNIMRDVSLTSEVHHFRPKIWESLASLSKPGALIYFLNDFLHRTIELLPQFSANILLRKMPFSKHR